MLLLPSRINKQMSAQRRTIDPVYGVDAYERGSWLTLPSEKGKYEGKNFSCISLDFVFQVLTNILPPLFGIIFTYDVVLWQYIQIYSPSLESYKGFESYEHLKVL